VAEPQDITELTRLNEAMELQQDLPFTLDLWSVQNKCYEILQSTYPWMLERALTKDEEAIAWVQLFQELGNKLKLTVEAPEFEETRK
jgi:hypothetical protein